MSEIMFDPSEAALGMHSIARPAHFEVVNKALAECDLAACTLCDGEPALGYQRALAGLWIACSKCGSTGPTIGLTVWLTGTELSDAARKAAEAWNAR